MKKFMKLTATTLAGLVLVGCTTKEPVVPSSVETTEIIEESSVENSETSESESIVENEGTPVIADLTFEITSEQDGYQQRAELRWKRDDVDCFFISPYAVLTELDVVQDVGLVGDHMYYFICGSKLYMIDLNTGEDIGPESRVGASCSWDFDENDTIYIAGFYGPDLAIISAEGKEIATYGMLNDDYIWPYEVKYEDGFVYITFEQEPVVLKVNVEDGSYTVEE